MATPTADKLRTYFPSRYIAADGNALTEYVVDSATLRNITDAALNEADDYWNGALGWFAGDTITADLRGCFFHIKNFDAASDTLTLSRDLPAQPVASDKFYMVIGGNRRSGCEIFGLAVSSQQPELIPYYCSSITGVVIKKASGQLGEGDVTLKYDPVAVEIYLQKEGEAYGVGVDVTASLTDAIVFAADGQSYLQFDVVSTSLPGVETTEVLTLAINQGVFTPDFEGYETSAVGGKVRYRLEILRNEDSADTMIDLSVYLQKPSGVATTITSETDLTSDEGDFEIDDSTDWPTNSFWVYNKTRNDCRYIKYRSGKTLYTTNAGAGLRDFTAVNWVTGDEVEVMGDIDIALELPDGSGVFSNPADESTAPGGLNFATHCGINSAIYYGDLDPGEMIGIWRRETVVENHRARSSIRTDTITVWS
jgi:hypothetical protein